MVPGVTISDSQTELVLQPHWVEWLGTIQTEHFKSSSLYITAVIEPEFPASDVPSHEFLGRRVRLLHHALSLLGCGFNSDVLMVGGESNNGSVRIGPIRAGLTPCFLFPSRVRAKIEPAHIQRAASILTNLEMIYSHVPDRLYRRIRKGFNIWIRGIEEGEAWNERLHSYVRAIEAIVKPTIARKRKKSKSTKKTKGGWRDITLTFIERGKSFLGKSDRTERFLRQLYDIRSSIEHTKDVAPAVKKMRGIDSRETFMFRALQSEILASEIYARILSDAKLLNAFSTESRVEGFWTLDGARRQALWGERIDIDAMARSQFFSHYPQEF